MAHKINFTAKVASDFRKALNAEYKGFNACIKFLVANWSNSELQKIAAKDGVRKSDLTADYIKKWLEGSNFCQGGVLGHTVIVDKATKAKEFRAYNTWTPGRVLDFVRRASAAHCKSLGI